MLLIHQGTTPTPGSEEWGSLSQEEQNEVYAAYAALNETPGFTPGERMQGPEVATTVRVQDGRTLTTDGPFAEVKEAIGGYIAVAEVDGAEAGLEIVDRLDLEEYRYLHATRAELLRRLGRTEDAHQSLRKALELVDDDAERRLLERRLAELGADGPTA